MKNSQIFDEIGQFTTVPNWAIEMGDEIGTDGLVLLMAFRYHSGNNGLIFPAYDTLKKHTGLTNRRIANAIRKLEELKIVERQKRFGQSTIYRLKNRLPPTSTPPYGELHNSPAGVLSVLQQVETNKTHLTRLTSGEEKISPNTLSIPVTYPVKEAFIGGKTPPMLKAKLDHLKPETTTEIEHGEEKISPNPLSTPITYPVQEESVTMTGKKDNLIKDPRVGAYRGLAHLTPNQVQREEICDRVTDLELWQTIITGWLGHGWNPKNITGMLEVYEKGGLDKSNRNNGHKTTINPGTDREVNSNFPTGVTKSDGVPGWNETYYERTETE